MNAINLFGIPLLAAMLIGTSVFVLMKMLPPIADFLKRKRILFAVISGLGGGIYVLAASVTVNNQERIAMAILSTDINDSIPAFKPHPSPALTGALNGKFPLGTNAENLISFVTKLGGNCHQDRLGQPVFCTILESGTFCISNSLQITAKTNNLNQIEGIEASRNFDAC